MTFLWPGLLLLLLAVPLLIAVYIWSLRRRRPSRRPLLEPVAGPCRPTRLCPLAPAPPVRAVRRGDRRARPRGRPAGRDRCACRPTRRRSCSSWTCRAACARATSSPPGWWRPRRRRPRSSSTRARAPRSGSSRSAGSPQIVQAPTNDKAALIDVAAEPDDRPPDGGRRRHPRGHRRHRRSGPLDPAKHRPRPAWHRAAPGHPRRIRAGHHRGPDRRRHQLRSGAGGRRGPGGDTRAARLHHRVRDARGRSARPDLCVAVPRPRAGRRVRWRRRRRRRRVPARHRRCRPPAGGRADRRDLLPGRERGPARGRLRRPPDEPGPEARRRRARGRFRRRRTAVRRRRLAPGEGLAPACPDGQPTVSRQV